MRFSTPDQQFMRRAIALAKRGQGTTSPNPAVGAVLVRGGRIVGEGFHRRAGGPHAEIVAIRAAQKRESVSRRRSGRRAPGLTLYVTLEPCSTWGKTPPCTDAIRAAGVDRVVVAAADPNPRHDGQGLKILRRAGMRVVSGLLAAEAARINAAFNKWIRTGLPLVVAKAAMSLDGKIATRSGDSQWITGRQARREAHRLRAQVDAVMVGAGTVRKDDPQLTVRLVKSARQPRRVIVDSRGRTPLRARVFSDRFADRSVVITSGRSTKRWRDALARRGVTVLVVSMKGGHVDPRRALRALGKIDVTSVLVEGGSQLLGSMFDRRLVDKVALFYAPVVIGGSGAVGTVGGEGVRTVAGAQGFSRDSRWRTVGPSTMLFEGYAERRHQR